MSDLSERADALEMRMARELQEKIAPIRSPIYLSGERNPCGVRDSSCSGTG